MPKITKRVVDALKPDPQKELFVWDDQLKGFGVRVLSSGAATYLIQYRNAEGRTRRHKLGSARTLTPEEARTLARERLAAVAKGSDPSAERRSAREAITVTEVCDWYLQEAGQGRLLGRNRRPIKASTLDMDQSRIATHVKPLIGARGVRSLTLGDIETFQAKVATGATAKPRSGRGGVTTGGDGVAGRTVGMLQSIFAHAKRQGLIEANPAEGVRKLADRRRERFLTASEIKRLGIALDEATLRGENLKGLAAIRLALLTGFRRTSEVLSLRWEWVNVDAKYIRFPDTKSNRPQTRVIGAPAAALLRRLPRQEGSPWVFPADLGDGHFVGVVRVLQRVCGIADLGDVSPHVLRHTFATTAAELGFTELTIRGLLGQASQGVTQRYVHLDQGLLVAADKVAERIEALLVEGAATATRCEGLPA